MTWAAAGLSRTRVALRRRFCAPEFLDDVRRYGATNDAARFKARRR
ncbi:hypothetical protein [Streptomyces cavernae]|nr:hypothetical protein [Streptomyces cavernae]